MTTSGPPAGPIRAVYQPIVDLQDGSVVAVEALARDLSDQRRPVTALFESVPAGAVVELDEACLRAALLGIGSTRGPLTVFVNIEPATLSALDPRRLAEWAALAPEDVRVVLEVTERDLLERSADLVRAVHWIRDLGWGVALDDVGAEPSGLALMPFLRPDVVKLDLALLRGHTTWQVATVVNAVRAEVERSGALVLAEGIETEQHLERALAMGARLGQGWMFGRPGPLTLSATAALHLPTPPGHVRTTIGLEPLTPYELLSAGSTPQRATERLLASMTRQLELQALLLDEHSVVLANFQDPDAMTPRTRRRYESLASVSALTAVTGLGMPDRPAPGVLGTALPAGDPLGEEWVVAVVGPHFAAVLAARDVPAGDAPPTPVDLTGPGTRRFDYVLSYDRRRVLDAADLLLDRVRLTSRVPAGTARVVSTSPARISARVPSAELPDLLLRAISTADNSITIADASLPDLPLVYVNDAFLRLTGYAEDEVLGRNCRFMQGPDTDADQVRPMHRRLLAGRPVHTVLLNHRKDGSTFWNELRLSPVTDATGEITHWIGNQVDVSERVDRERRTTYLAHHDPLTGLPNRAHLLEHLDLELRRARRSGGSVAAVLLDLDGFKAINDRLGHAAGDAALCEAARRLRSAIRAGDLLGRLGGDEFLVVLADLPASGGPAVGLDGALTADETVDRVRQHLHDALAHPLELAGAAIRLGASSGAALFPRDAGDATTLIAQADVCMYRNKTRR